MNILKFNKDNSEELTTDLIFKCDKIFIKDLVKDDDFFIIPLRKVKGSDCNIKYKYSYATRQATGTIVYNATEFDMFLQRGYWGSVQIYSGLATHEFSELKI